MTGMNTTGTSGVFAREFEALGRAIEVGFAGGRVISVSFPTDVPADATADHALLDRIDSAGSAFLGPYSPVAAGDYASGPNHVLPTGGNARRVGGLSVETFLRSSTVQRLDRDALDDIAGTITTLARTEGLEAHAESVEKRFE